MAQDEWKRRERWDDRPDWKDRRSYEFPGRTEYAKWAWEFLRRNVEFQKVCWEQRNGKRQGTERDVARKWGLEDFKDCIEPYDEGDAPVFRPPGVSLCHNLAVEESRTAKIKLGSGKMAVTFDLSAALQDGGLLESWFPWAREQVVWHLSVLADKKKPNAKPVRRRVRAQDYPGYLRVLDAIDGGGRTTKDKEVALAIYGSGTTNDLKRIRDALKVARKATRRSRYLWLAFAKPKRKTVTRKTKAN